MYCTFRAQKFLCTLWSLTIEKNLAITETIVARQFPDYVISCDYDMNYYVSFKHFKIPP